MSWISIKVIVDGGGAPAVVVAELVVELAVADDDADSPVPPPAVPPASWAWAAAAAAAAAAALCSCMICLNSLMMGVTIVAEESRAGWLVKKERAAEREPSPPLLSLPRLTRSVGGPSWRALVVLLEP